MGSSSTNYRCAERQVVPADAALCMADARHPQRPPEQVLGHPSVERLAARLAEHERATRGTVYLGASTADPGRFTVLGRVRCRRAAPSEAHHRSAAPCKNCAWALSIGGMGTLLRVECWGREWRGGLLTSTPRAAPGYCRGGAAVFAPLLTGRAGDHRKDRSPVGRSGREQSGR
jgi:hypothetical protein